MAEQDKAVKRDRTKRVRRLKRMIIIMVIAGIVIPTVLCIFLLIKVAGMERKIEELYESRQRRETAELQLAAGLSQAGGLIETLAAAEGGRNEEQQVPEEETEADVPDDGMRKVYLTFDDGPSIYTQEILNILEAYDVKATFFVVGREDEDSLELYRQIVADGHTLGMHSYSHVYSQIYASRDAFIEDMTRLRELLYTATGVRPVFCRFPGGSSNRVSRVDMQELISWLDGQGITYFDWNISSGDASGGGLSMQRIVENATSDLSKHEEAVILMHDAPGKGSTVEALPIIIERIMEMDNTQLLPITQDTEPVQHIKPVRD